MGKFIAPNPPVGPKVIKRKVITKSSGKKQPTVSKSKKPGKNRHAVIEEAKKIRSEARDLSTPVFNKTSKTTQEASEFQDLEFEVIKNSCSGNKYLKLLRPIEDLFADDDLKAKFDQNTKHNLIFTIFDEIALEGLDGITLQAFWQRIQKAIKLHHLPLNFKELMWQLICLNEKIEFFELPEPRENLFIPNRERDVNDVNPIDFGGDIYKVENVPRNSGLFGSCVTLNTRVNVSKIARNKTLVDATYKYGDKLVLVADPNLRRNALFDGLVDPNHETTHAEYCVLERIGRARDFGEVTLGQASLAHALKMDSRSLHYYSKNLKKSRLILGQFCMVASNMEHTKTGRLFHLRRFYNKRKTKYMIMMENVIQYLRKCPGYRAPYYEIKNLFNYNVQTFFKHQDFNKYIDTNVYVPHKEYYPNAPFKEYMVKSLAKERVVHLMQLKDPYVNIVASWGESDSSDDDDDEDCDNDANKGRRIFNKDLIRDVYQYILFKGLDGAKSTDIIQNFDTDIPGMRVILKKLTKRQLVQPKKKEVGKQTVYQYVATCLIGKAGIPQCQSTLTQTGTSSALEKLKQKQKQKIVSVATERVYTLEQFQSDREHKLLSLDSTFQLMKPEIPKIICHYLITLPPTLEITKEVNIFLVKFKENLIPFKINLKLPRISQNTNFSLSLENVSSFIIKNDVFDYTGEIICHKFIPDNFSKVCLLRALIDNLQINSQDVINFLNPKSSSKEAVKRPLTNYKIVKGSENERVNNKTDELGIYMGSNPILILTEKDFDLGFLTEIYVTTPIIGDYMTGDITNYTSSAIADSTDRVLSRINVILKAIQKTTIFEELFKLLRVICQEEAKEGYDKKMDRRSLHRILKRLADEGYIKIFQVFLSNEDLKKTQIYVCHPDVTIENVVLKENIRQLKEKVFCYIKKSDEPIPEPAQKKSVPERSPFIEDDVLESINEIKSLTVSNIKVHSSKTAAKYYGKRPKFSKLSLIHELLFYLIYELDKDTKPLSKEEVSKLFNNHQIRLTQADLQNLPPVYCKEISWKTFIPPLPYHVSWGEGWALLVDVLVRFPISLITRCHAVNFISSELQELLQHPIKRFYLMRNVSPNIRMIIMYKRKFIHDMHSNLVLLCYCGLLQFGPSVFHDKEKSFFYLNRKATLWDTISSSPGYHKIEDKEYPTISFYFKSLDDVFKYWSTMVNICIHTNLSSRKGIEGKTITLIESSAKPVLNKARCCRNQRNVKTFDTGQIPGDHQGAAGLDSSLWSHKHRSWYFFAPTKNTMNETLASLKLEKIANNKVAYDLLKVPANSTKYFIPQKKTIKNLKQVKRIGKTIVNRTIVARKLKPISEKKVGLDSVDKATMKKLNFLRYRPKWSKDEDRLLILFKVASQIITPDNPKQIISYTVVRDIMHIVDPESRNKTSRVIANRLKLLRRDVPFLANVESLIPNLYKLPLMAKYFVPFRKFILNEQNTSGFQRKYKLSDMELQNAFVFLAYYFVTNRKEVEVSLHGRNTNRDYFNKMNFDYYKENIEPFSVKQPFYSTPKNEADIRKNTLKSTIHAALCHKIDNPIWCLQVYKIYQQFNEQVLRETLVEMRNSRMINLKRDPGKTFFSSYRLSSQYIFYQSCTFWFTTMEEAYTTFLDLKHNPNSIDFSYDNMTKKTFGQMFGINEILSLMLSDVTFNFHLPEHHLILNPNIEDHSEVIDELAKRYEAKLKNDLKEAENHDQISSNTDEDCPEVSEPVPGPSTAKPTESPENEIISFDDEEPLDLSITAKNSATIDNLKHWISDCIDAERVRSPSPELLNLEVSQEKINDEGNVEKNADKLSVKGLHSRILSLKEIKEEMLKQYDSPEKRLVPYISDLTKLFSQNFEEIEGEETGYNLMRKHFVQEYPSLEKITVNGLDGHYFSEYLENRSSVKDIWIKLEKESYVGTPSDTGVAFDEILKKGGTVEDVSLAYAILEYIHEKEIHGLPGHELKEQFVHFENTCSLELIIETLTKHHILLKAGVCAVTYVHYKFRNVWLTDTFTITPEQATFLTSKNKEESVADDQIKALDINKWIKIKPFPWFTVDGLLDKDMIKMWLSHVFSYCIENPKVPMTRLCDKFSFLKPVDVFYLAETLEEIGALELRRELVNVVNLYSEYDMEVAENCRATALDKFEEIYIETNNVGFLMLGSFLNDL